MSHPFIIIDEHGECFLDNADKKVAHPEVITEILKNVRLTDNFNLTTTVNDQTHLIEAFDHPLIAHKVEVADQKILIHAQNDLIFEANPEKFSVDAFDRFCGLTKDGAPFRLTEKAQEKLFQNCDEFDDDSFTLKGLKVQTPSYYFHAPDITKPDYWAKVYDTEGSPGWDLQNPAEAFKDMLPRIKLPKSRVLVLGCGEGHDAALFAQAGHVVTAVDFSPEGIKRGKEKYKHLTNLHFVQEDIFKLPSDWNHSFDLIVEHTCFCAIPPERRKDLVTLWRRLLHEEGQLMAVFFAMLKRAGPPYGSSEWELRELMKPYFQFLFWGRWRNSLPRRQGRELFVLAKKR